MDDFIDLKDVDPKNKRR